MQLPVVLPLLTFGAIMVLFWGASGVGPSSPGRDWRPAFLRAAIVWGALALVFTELLSPFHAIDRVWLSVCWGLSALGLWWLAWRRGAMEAARGQLRIVHLIIPWQDAVLVGGIVAVAGLLFAVAWMSPPSNVDSLLYHMARVVHWAQNRSLAHYPTAYGHQLLKPIWAELAILNLRVLWGSDRVAGLVQWFSMLGSLIGVSWIASLMGTRLRGQLLAALFALSIPMGILQSTSTQNDYVVAFWAVCLLALVVEGKKGPQSWLDKGMLAVVVGIGTLTKGTFFVYAIPLLVWHFLPKLWRERPKAWLSEGVLVVLVVVICNAGFWARNIVTYGGPYGTSGWLRGNLTFLQVASAPPVSPPPQASTPPPGEAVKSGEPGGVAESGESTGPGARVVGLVSRLGGKIARMVAFNQVTPSAAINAPILAGLRGYPQVFGQEFFVDMAIIAWNHEDTAGNPLHLVLILGSFVVVFFVPRSRRDPSLVPTSLTVLATFLMIPIVVGHGASLEGLRYQLPFFVLWAPIFGVAVSAILRAWLGWVVGLAMLLASLPWVLFNNTRPVIGLPPWPTRTESVFAEDPSKLAFAIMAGSRDPSKREAILAAADIVRSRGCTQVGLAIDSNGLEYLYWWVLEAPQSGVAIQTLNPTPESSRYLDPGFRPCVVICTLCTDQEDYSGLPMITDFSGVRVFGDGS